MCLGVPAIEYVQVLWMCLGVPAIEYVQVLWMCLGVPAIEYVQVLWMCLGVPAIEYVQVLWMCLGVPAIEYVQVLWMCANVASEYNSRLAYCSNTCSSLMMSAATWNRYQNWVSKFFVRLSLNWCSVWITYHNNRSSSKYFRVVK